MPVYTPPVSQETNEEGIMSSPIRSWQATMRICMTSTVAALVLLLVAACGGSDETQESPTTSPSTPAAAQPTATVAADPPTATVAADPPSDSGATNGGTTVVTLLEGSEALYRINEQLANRNLPNDAIGTTEDIDGQIVFSADGTVDAEQSKITVNVKTLQSDSDRRDRYIRGRSLESDDFPNVEIVVQDVQGLPWPLPASGQVAFQMSGDLTIRDQTRLVTWDVTANFDGGEVEGLAMTEVTFEQFAITKPSVAFVLSVADEIGLEFEFKAAISGG